MSKSRFQQEYVKSAGAPAESPHWPLVITLPSRGQPKSYFAPANTAASASEVVSTITRARTSDSPQSDAIAAPQNAPSSVHAPQTMLPSSGRQLSSSR